MAKLQLPLMGQGLSSRSPLPPQSPLSDYVQQALSLIMGYTYSETVPLRASPAGILYVAEPRISDVFQWTSVGASESHQGANILCTQVMCVAHPANTGYVWVRPRSAATTANAIPLEKGQHWTFSVENLNELYALIAALGDTLIVAYSL